MLYAIRIICVVYSKQSLPTVLYKILYYIRIWTETIPFKYLMHVCCCCQQVNMKRQMCISQGLGIFITTVTSVNITKAEVGKGRKVILLH